MKRFAAVLFLVLITGCASAPVERTPLEKAKLAYADGSLAYEFGMLAIVELRAARLVNDAQWSRVEQAQTVARQYAPLVRAGLDLWTATGQEPEELNAAFQKLWRAFSEIKAVKAEVQP
jgi:hypothetical protein